MAEQKHSIHDVELSDEQWRSIEQVIRNALRHGPRANEELQYGTDTCELAPSCCDETVGSNPHC
jgi:hypothetical protein